MPLIDVIRALLRPLRFGDPDQIKAVDMLGEVQACIEAIEACPHRHRRCPTCKGTGEADCECLECGNLHYAKCYDCEGTGEESGKGCQECLKPFPEYIRTEARTVMEFGWPKDLKTVGMVV